MKYDNREKNPFFLPALIAVLIPAYLSHNIHHECPQITTHSLSPEESASIESVREEIDRALNGDTVTRATQS